MTLPKPDLVIFDMDGTTVRHLDPTILHLFEFLDDTAYRCTKFFSWIFKRSAKGPIVPPTEEKDRKQRRRKSRVLMHRAIHKVRRKSVEQIVKPREGVIDVMDFLQSQGIPMALISNGLGKGYGHDILQKFDLEKYYYTTIFREDISKAKPNPESLLSAYKNHPKKIDDDGVIWYIGDRHKDITAAIAANDKMSQRVVPIACAINAAVAVMEKGLGMEQVIMDYDDLLVRLHDIFASEILDYGEFGDNTLRNQSDTSNKTIH